MISSRFTRLDSCLHSTNEQRNQPVAVHLHHAKISRKAQRGSVRTIAKLRIGETCQSRFVLLTFDTFPKRSESGSLSGSNVETYFHINEQGGICFRLLARIRSNKNLDDNGDQSDSHLNETRLSDTQITPHNWTHKYASQCK